MHSSTPKRHCAPPTSDFPCHPKVTNAATQIDKPRCPQGANTARLYRNQVPSQVLDLDLLLLKSPTTAGWPLLATTRTRETLRARRRRPTVTCHRASRQRPPSRSAQDKPKVADFVGCPLRLRRNGRRPFSRGTTHLKRPSITNESAPTALDAVNFSSEGQRP